jgi:hypothetical protein
MRIAGSGLSSLTTGWQAVMLTASRETSMSGAEMNLMAGTIDRKLGQRTE